MFSPIKYIFQELEHLKPYIYHRASTGSVYIKFKDPALCSLRIADHRGRMKYKYKWNLMLNESKARCIMDRGTLRRYYPLSEIDKLISEIKDESIALSQKRSKIYV